MYIALGLVHTGSSIYSRALGGKNRSGIWESEYWKKNRVTVFLWWLRLRWI